MKEVIVTEQLQLLLTEYAETSGIVLSLENEEMNASKANQYVAHLPMNLQGVAKRLLHYVERTQMRSLSHIQSFNYTEANHYLRIDTNSKRNRVAPIYSWRGFKRYLIILLDEQ